MWLQVSDMKEERRILSRYECFRLSYYAIDRGSKLAGTIRDIGRKGLSFEYTPTDGSAPEPVAIDISLNKKPYIKGIACESVYDIQTLAYNGAFTGENLRRCGVRFQGVTENQSRRIEQMITNCKPYLQF